LKTSEQSAEVLNVVEGLRDCLLAGVVAVDSRGQVCAFNLEAESLTGIGALAIIGCSFKLLPSPVQRLIEDTLAAKAAISGRLLVWTADSGRCFELQASSAHCVTAQGASAGVVVTLNDLASAHRLGLHMQRLDQLAGVGILSASMAHEIKNALVAVNTFAEDLLERNQETEMAALVRRELQRIDAIATQMLKFAGPAKPSFSPIEVHGVLDHCLRLLHSQLEAKQIRLVRSWGAKPDAIQADAYQLEQVAINILLNALAAMNSGGQLLVATEIVVSQQAFSGSAPKKQLQVSISDTGVGIAPEHLPRLFEPFFTTKPEGNGLGLAISRRIILEHGGTISVESELGKGTAFRIRLPLANPGLGVAH
jgi:signal transduction histidine kinase